MSNNILGSNIVPQLCDYSINAYSVAGCGDAVGKYVPQGCPGANNKQQPQVTEAKQEQVQDRFTNPKKKVENFQGTQAFPEAVYKVAEEPQAVWESGLKKMNPEPERENEPASNTFKFPDFISLQDGQEYLSKLGNEYDRYYFFLETVTKDFISDPGKLLKGSYVVNYPGMGLGSYDARLLETYQGTLPDLWIFGWQDDFGFESKVYIYDQDGSQGPGYYITAGGKFESLQYHKMAPDGISLNEIKYEDLTLEQSQIIMHVVLEELKKSIDEVTSSESDLNTLNCNYNNISLDCYGAIKKMAEKILKYKQNIKKAEDAVELVNQKDLQMGNNVDGHNLVYYFNHEIDEQDPYVYYYIEVEQDYLNNNSNNLYRNNRNNYNTSYYYYSLFIVLLLSVVLIYLFLKK